MCSHNDLITDAICNAISSVTELVLKPGLTVESVTYRSFSVDPLHKVILSSLCGFSSLPEAERTLDDVEQILRSSIALMIHHMKGRLTRRPEQIAAACGFLLLSTSMMMQQPRQHTITALVGVAMCYLYGDAALDDPEFSIDDRLQVGAWGAKVLESMDTSVKIPEDLPVRLRMYCTGLIDGFGLITEGYPPSGRPGMYKAISKVWCYQVLGLRIQSGLTSATWAELENIGNMKGGYSVVVSAEICLNVETSEGILEEDHGLLMQMGSLIQLVDDVIDVEDDIAHDIKTQVTEHLRCHGNLDAMFLRMEQMCKDVGEAWFQTAKLRSWKFVLPEHVMRRMLLQAYITAPIFLRKHSSPEFYHSRVSIRDSLGLKFDDRHILEQLTQAYEVLRTSMISAMQLR